MDWWGFKATSMICRPLTRSMRRLDYFDYRAATSSSVLRAFDPAPPLLIELLMLIGEKVKPQTIARPALDVMTLPLPADKTEVEALDDPARGLPSPRPTCRPSAGRDRGTQDSEALSRRGFHVPILGVALLPLFPRLSSRRHVERIDDDVGVARGGGAAHRDHQSVRTGREARSRKHHSRRKPGTSNGGGTRRVYRGRRASIDGHRRNPADAAFEADPAHPRAGEAQRRGCSGDIRAAGRAAAEGGDFGAAQHPSAGGTGTHSGVVLFNASGGGGAAASGHIERIDEHPGVYRGRVPRSRDLDGQGMRSRGKDLGGIDRKSTRLN